MSSSCFVFSLSRSSAFLLLSNSISRSWDLDSAAIRVLSTIASATVYDGFFSVLVGGGPDELLFDFPFFDFLFPCSPMAVVVVLSLLLLLLFFEEIV